MSDLWSDIEEILERAAERGAVEPIMEGGHEIGYVEPAAPPQRPYKLIVTYPQRIDDAAEACAVGFGPMLVYALPRPDDWIFLSTMVKVVKFDVSGQVRWFIHQAAMFGYDANGTAIGVWSETHGIPLL